MPKDDDDPLLFSHQAAEVAGVKTRTWLRYVESGLAPAPDDPDLERPVGRRMARWRKSRVEFFRDNRVGRGYRRDLRTGGGAAPSARIVPWPGGIEDEAARKQFVQDVAYPQREA